MIDILWRNGLLPSIVTWVEEVETATGVLQADARAATVLGGFWIVGVAADEDERAVLLCQADVDRGWRIAVRAMLESILDERDKKQWRHF